MNKQELIGILEGLEGDSFIEKYNEGYDQAVRDCLIAVKQLDEPKKVFVPRSVAEMIETYREKEISLAYLMRYFKSWHNKVYKGTIDSEALNWIVNNLEEFLDAWIHGYEVEKEPRYVISAPNNSFYKHYLARFINNNFEKPVFRHIGEEDPLFIKDKAKAAVIADWVKGTVEKWEEE
ncbi:DUF1642 domain-containing protein [Enterococcus sp. DIV1758]|uniref:DUF1642 domain-containing protein n=1 Tax=Enterococcus sp. DIV1758 TaxID=2774744 RepID=UPI003F238CBF